MGGLAVILFLAVTVVTSLLSGMAALRQSSVVQEAMARALANPQAISELGEPVRPGRLVYGKLRTRGQFGFADFEVPLVGPKARGTLSGVALRIRGEWQFRRLDVKIAGFPSIDLLPTENAK